MANDGVRMRRLHLCCVCAAVLAACHPTASRQAPRPDVPDAGEPAPASAGASRNGLDRFDRLITPELVFPQAADRTRYSQAAPETKDGRRTYGFELRPQASMVPDRNFHLIAIDVAPAGTFVDPATNGTKPTTSAGPNGSFSDVSVRTDDGRFDIRVSEAMLLPEEVAAGQFDMIATAAELVRRYGQLETQPDQTR